MAIQFPTVPAAYGETQYWESRYIEEREKFGSSYHFEWYCSLDDLWPILETYCGSNELARETARVLVVGCGTSRLPQDLQSHGLDNVLAVDLSKAVISQMQTKYDESEGLQFAVVDARKMDRLANDSFDLVLDKACMDAVFCSLHTYEDVLRMNQEVCRVLRPGKQFVSVSRGSPPTRLPHLRHPSLSWDVEHVRLDPPTNDDTLLKSIGLHVYICTKRRQTNNLMLTSEAGIGEVQEEIDRDWEELQKKSSTTTIMDKRIKGHLRLAKLRDAESVLADWQKQHAGEPEP